MTTSNRNRSRAINRTLARKINHSQQPLTADQIRRLPEIGAGDGQGFAAVAVVKFFCGPMTWFGTEFSPETGEFFGYTIHQGYDQEEWGYFSLEEFQDMNDARLARRYFGPCVERDIHFSPKSVGEAVREFLGRPARFDDTAPAAGATTNATTTTVEAAACGDATTCGESDVDTLISLLQSLRAAGVRSVSLASLAAK